MLKRYLPAIGAGLIIGILGIFKSLSHSKQKMETESVMGTLKDSIIVPQNLKKDSLIESIHGGYGREFVVFYERLISRNDSVQIAEEMFYPLHTALEGHKGTLNIKDKKSFIKYYHPLFNRKKNLVQKDHLHDVFSNYKGIV